MNLIIQYTLAGAALVGAVVWVIVKTIKAHKARKSGRMPSGCCGCPISGRCQETGDGKGKGNCSGQ